MSQFCDAILNVCLCHVDIKQYLRQTKTDVRGCAEVGHWHTLVQPAGELAQPFVR